MPGELFDSSRQSAKINAFPVMQRGDVSVRSGRFEETGMMPAATNGSLPVPRSGGGGGLLSRTGKFPQIGTGLMAAVERPTMIPTADAFPMSGMVSPLATKTLTGTLPASAQPGNPNTMKLTGPVKVVQVPVAGQPGRFVTGLLPMLSQTADEQVAKKKAKPWVKFIALAVAILLILGAAAGAALFVHSHPNLATTSTQPKVNITPNVNATAVAKATAVVQANIILNDHLDRNINNWLTTPANVYAFKDGAYHITDRGNNGRATVLQSGNFGSPLAYSLTMQEVNGNDTSPVNSFGMIFRFNQQTKGNATTTTFYSFEVVNTNGGEYQFWKYDDTKGTANAWTRIWHGNFGKEFHQGHGVQATNTFKIFMQGASFTFTVNGHAVKTVQDKSLQSGMIGMIVNLNGTEVAFKNLLLTHN